jgi:hypothetical protein
VAGAEGAALGVSTIGSVGPLQSAKKGRARRFSLGARGSLNRLPRCFGAPE